MTPGERLRYARMRAGLSQAKLAQRAGTYQGVISAIERGEESGKIILPKLAEALEVPIQWLSVGDKPGTLTVTEEIVEYEATGGLRYRGSVAADDDKWREQTTVVAGGSVPLRAGLWLLQVKGSSAYPVLFPGQFVIVDPHRQPNNRNLVACWTMDGRCLLKRYHQTDEVEAGFILVSPDIAKDIYIIPKGEVLQVYPVVGTLFAYALDWDDPEVMGLVEKGDVELG